MNALETRVIELLDRRRALNNSRADVIDEIERINSRFLRTQSFDSLQKAIEYDNDKRIGKNQVERLQSLCDSYAKEMHTIEEDIMKMLTFDGHIILNLQSGDVVYTVSLHDRNMEIRWFRKSTSPA
jgi:ferritin-like metal-binding protein YciE